MKDFIGSLIFSLVVVIVVMVAITAIGYLVTYVLPINFSEEISELQKILARSVIGLTLLGFACGLSKMSDLFLFCMKVDPNKEPYKCPGCGREIHYIPGHKGANQ